MCGGGRRVTRVWWREKGDPCVVEEKGDPCVVEGEG